MIQKSILWCPFGSKICDFNTHGTQEWWQFFFFSFFLSYRFYIYSHLYMCLGHLTIFQFSFLVMVLGWQCFRDLKTLKIWNLVFSRCTIPTWSHVATHIFLSPSHSYSLLIFHFMKLKQSVHFVINSTFSLLYLETFPYQSTLNIPRPFLRLPGFYFINRLQLISPLANG
jgi:hypothetical protein